jgi:hypothetical protein
MELYLAQHFGDIDVLFLVVAMLIGVCIVPMLLGIALNKHLPVWACTRMGWHLAPQSMGFDGCSLKGICPRCGKHVLQDSQGNWF